MTPRPDIVAIQEDATMASCARSSGSRSTRGSPSIKAISTTSSASSSSRTCCSWWIDADDGRPMTPLIRPMTFVPGDQARPRAAQGVPAQAGPDCDRRRRIRRDRGPGDHRRSARGDRRRDPRRVRRRVRAGRRRGQRVVRLQREGELRRGSRAPRCRDRARRVRDGRRLRPDAGWAACPRSARRSSSTA